MCIRDRSALASALDSDYEVIHGQTLTGAGALLMRRYMHEYGVAPVSYTHLDVYKRQVH